MHNINIPIWEWFCKLKLTDHTFMMSTICEDLQTLPFSTIHKTKNRIHRFFKQLFPSCGRHECIIHNKNMKGNYWSPFINKTTINWIHYTIRKHTVKYLWFYQNKKYSPLCPSFKLPPYLPTNQSTVKAK